VVVGGEVPVACQLGGDGAGGAAQGAVKERGGGGGAVGVQAAAERARELAAVEAAELGEGEAEVGGPGRGPAGRPTLVVARVAGGPEPGDDRPSARTTVAESYGWSRAATT
jgi:hypothetical protein